MIVKYVRERGYKGQGQDPSLTLGKHYYVFGFDIRPDGYPNYISIRRESDGTPVLFEYSCFEVVDPRIPDGWCFFHLSEPYQRLDPCEFGGDFWDLFHDGDSEAEAVFEKVAKKIEAFHSSS